MSVVVGAVVAAPIRTDYNLPETRLMLGDVERAIQRLKKPHREALRFVAVADLSYSEAAALMGISEAAVRSNLWRGRAKLRRLCKIDMGGVRRGMN